MRRGIRQLLASALKEEREEQQLSQAKFAARCGVEQSWISRVESGSGDPLLEPTLRVLRRFKSEKRLLLTLIGLLNSSAGKSAKTARLTALLDGLEKTQSKDGRLLFLERIADWLVEYGDPTLAVRYLDRALQTAEILLSSGEYFARRNEFMIRRKELAKLLEATLGNDGLRLSWLSGAVRGRLQSGGGGLR